MTQIATLRENLTDELNAVNFTDFQITGCPKHLWSIIKRWSVRQGFQHLRSYRPTRYHQERRRYLHFGAIHDCGIQCLVVLRDYMYQHNLYQSLHTEAAHGKRNYSAVPSCHGRR